MSNDLDPVVYIRDSTALADSRNVSSYFHKQHKDVLKAIRELNCSPEFRQRNYAPFKNNDLTGESTSHVEMTKDGFTFLAFGFTGAKAAAFKEAYIAKFNAMEVELRRQSAPNTSASLPDALRMINSAARVWDKVVVRQLWLGQPSLPKVAAMYEAERQFNLFPNEWARHSHGGQHQ